MFSFASVIIRLLFHLKLQLVDQEIPMVVQGSANDLELVLMQMVQPLDQ